MKATSGRIVHYVLAEGPRRGEHRPAMVTSAEDNYGNQKANLQLFLEPGDFPEPEPIEPEPTTTAVGEPIACRVMFIDTGFREAVPFGADCAPGTWHWPEREE